MSKDVTLRQMRYFVAAAQNGQFSMAAATEHVSQSAITNAVLALEETLGTRLFERLPQGVALTPDGQDFLNHARHILDSVRDAIYKAPFRSHDLKGTVRIAASYTLLGYFLPELMGRFRATYPHVELDLRDADRPEIEQAILDGDIDLGVALAIECGSSQTVSASRADPFTASVVDRADASAGTGELAVARGHCGVSVYPHYRRRERTSRRCVTGRKTASSRTSHFARVQWRRCADWWRMASA